jgi:hypothetical protein
MIRKHKPKIDGLKLATLLYGPPKTKTTQQKLELEEEAPHQVQDEKADEQGNDRHDSYL